MGASHDDAEARRVAVGLALAAVRGDPGGFRELLQGAADGVAAVWALAGMAAVQADLLGRKVVPPLSAEEMLQRLAMRALEDDDDGPAG